MPVPVENRIGEEGEGFLVAMSAIDQGRFTVAAGSVGLAQACLDASVKYARERQTFGEEIGRHQLVKQMIAKMAAGTEMGRLLVWRAAWLKNQGRRNTRETSLAKWHATDHAVQSALDAIQVHGANGYSNEFPVERYLRNSKAAVIYEGTSQLHTLIQADYALGYREDRPIRCEPWPAQGWDAGSGPDRRAMTPWTETELATLAELAETFVRGDALRRARLTTEALERAADPSQVRQLRLVLRLIESPLVNLLLTRRARSFRTMSPATRERYLLSWATSRDPAAPVGLPGASESC